jgi:hypothetical protein
LKVIYLLSDSFNYSQLVCDDAGHGYALSMNWDCLHLRDFTHAASEAVFVIDNRIEQHELTLLESIIKKNAGVLFFLKIVDPYFEHSEHYYYQFLSKISSLKNAYLLSAYQAVEITAQLKMQFNKRYIYLPYPYLRHKEINTDKKDNKIIISGSINPVVYPYRTAVWRKVTRSFTRFLFFQILRHPGYIDVNPGEAHTHEYIKDRFIQYLSQYKYMLLCPSRCNIEFLKFNECAYAGCLPAGLAPNSYPDNIKALFLQLRPESLVKDTLKIIFGRHREHTVQKLRLFLYETRNPDVLNKKLKESIENTLHTS